MKYLAFIISIMVAVSAYASEKIYDQFSDADPDKPWHINAEKITYDEKADIYIASGNVSITKNDIKISADFVRFNYKIMKVDASGHVFLTSKEDFLTGSSLEFDLETKTGIIYNGTIFLKENHFYIRGNLIKKVGEYTYTADKASISSCDGDKPAWKITGKNLKITIEGYGFVKHAAFWIKDIPVMYMPYMVFPVKLKRQTGLLSPQYAYSNRNGVEYIQPFFWAINKSSDATFYEHHLQRRGDKVGLEYRYILSENSKGTMMYDYLNDRKIDDGTGSSSEDWGYEDDNVLRPNSDRYWFRMKYDQEMPLGFSAKLDLDIVSDQDYLHEFRDGYTGFLKTDEYFYENFGRDLDDNGDSTRVNKLNLNKIWFNYSMNIETRWYDNVIIRRQEELDTTLQKLPFVEFDGPKQRFLGTPFYFDLDTEYTHFYRKDGTPSENITSCHRTDVHPRFYLPLRFKNYFTFEPSYGIRTTTWNIDEYESTPTESDRIQNRVIYDTRLDLSTEIFKTFDINGKSIDRIKHAVRPQIVHEYIPEKIQDQYPYFDSMDRIDKKNLVTYSLTNTFTSKLKEYIKKTDDHNEDNNELYGFKYNQFMRLKLEQSCDINIANETDSYKWANKETKQPFSPVKGTLELVPLKYFSIYADAEWSQHENEILSHNTLANLFDQRGDNLLVEHRYQRDSSGSVQDGKQSIYTYCLLKISDRLSTYGEFERNIYDKENMKKGLGFLYESQCWSIEVIYTDEAEEQKYLFMVNLYGLGGFHTGFKTNEKE